jgi:hypothetical protein
VVSGVRRFIRAGELSWKPIHAFQEAATRLAVAAELKEIFDAQQRLRRMAAVSDQYRPHVSRPLGTGHKSRANWRAEMAVICLDIGESCVASTSRLSV